jgi:hypothetical protein
MPGVAIRVGTGEMSNASKSKNAADATKNAIDASQRSGDDDWKSHQQAADAHYDAAWKQRDAGNATRASQHRAQAQVHQEKADAGRRAEQFADEQGRAAHELTKKAEMSQFGPDSKDPRTPVQLHQDAAQAHQAASAAYEMSGNKRAAAYHAAKADGHARLGDTSRAK